MPVKLFDSELKIMEILWNQGDSTAKHIAEITGKQVGWSKTTTYTVIRKCIDKGAAERREPNFLCHALVTRKQAQDYETTELINKMYHGSADWLVASLLSRKTLSADEIARLRRRLDEFKGE